MDERFAGAKTVLLISHVIPILRAAGNEVRILKALQWLKEEGFTNIVLFNQVAVADSTRQMMASFVDAIYTTGDLIAAIDSEIVDPVLAPYQCRHPDKKGLCPRELVSQTHQICQRHNPEVVIAEYVFTAPCLDVAPRKTLRCIDTHDMFSRRDQKESLYCTPEEERDYLLKSNLIWAIVENEAKMFRALVPEREVIVVGHHSDFAPRVDDDHCQAGSVLVVGSGNQPNRQGLADFCVHAWPIVREKCPDAKLRIVGKVGLGATFSDTSIQTVGWVEDAETEYAQAQVVINPTAIGTGLKIKTVEALCFGKAFVGTLNSVEGLPEMDPKPFIACPDWLSFAESIVMLLSSPEVRRKYQLAALQYAKANFSKEISYGPLLVKLAQKSARSR